MKKIFSVALILIFVLFVWSGPAISKLTIDAVEQTDGGTYVNPTITGGTIDGTPIGQTTPAAGSFATLETDILKLDHNVEVLAADKTLVTTDKVIQKLDPDGTDRNVLLPAENTATDLVFFVYNMGGEVGEDLNIQDDASGALAGVGYEQMGICTCDGTTWTVSTVCCNGGSCILNFRGKEENTSNVVTGQPVYISGATGAAFPNYGLADCDDSSKIRVKGLAAEDVTQNTTGYVRVKGLLEGVDSTQGNVVNPNSEDWTAGDQLWVSTTAGGLTNVRPLGRSIKIGTALTVEGANSKILVDVRENSIYTGAAAGEDIIRQMGDNAGANKISYRDSDGNEVGCRNSYGRVRNSGVVSRTITDADVTLTTADLGKSIRMSSAADHVASLPSAGVSDDGAKIRIVKTGAGKVTVDAADSDLINDSGAGDTIYNDVAAETYAFIDLEYVHAITTWIATGTGTWVTTD